MGWETLASIGYPRDSVGQFICDMEWQLPPTSNVAAVQEWKNIEGINLPTGAQMDLIIWKPQASGCFSLKFAWENLQSQKPLVDWAPVVWHKLGIPKFSCCSFLAFSRRLLTKKRLTRMGFQVDSSCVLCRNNPETLEPLFSMSLFCVCLEKM